LWATVVTANARRNSRAAPRHSLAAASRDGSVPAPVPAPGERGRLAHNASDVADESRSKVDRGRAKARPLCAKRTPGDRARASRIAPTLPAGRDRVFAGQV